MHTPHVCPAATHAYTQVPPGLPDFSPADRAHVGQELSDVLLYLIRLADVAGVDLGTAVRDKLAANAVK
jgi:dCTP diphosphatase